MVIVSAQVESELVDLDGDDKREFLESLGAFFVLFLLFFLLVGGNGQGQQGIIVNSRTTGFIEVPEAILFFLCFLMDAAFLLTKYQISPTARVHRRLTAGRRERL